MAQIPCICIFDLDCRGMDIWRIENFKPIPLPKSSFGKFYTGDSYIILRTTALKSGAFHYDIHFWLGKDTSQDEAGAAAIKTVELDAALGGRAVQFRETQGHETEKFLTYFKPCIIPLEGGVASGFKKVESEKVEPRLFVVKGRRAVRVNQACSFYLSLYSILLVMFKLEVCKAHLPSSDYLVI
jgi:gelsolin